MAELAAGHTDAWQALAAAGWLRRVRAVGAAIGADLSARRAPTASRLSLACSRSIAQIKAVHVAAVLLSGALFLLRGLLVQAGAARWAMWAPVRYASYSIDTVLLTAH